MPAPIASAWSLKHMATPAANPPSGSTLLYVKSDGKVYTKNSVGTETLVGPFDPRSIQHFYDSQGDLVMAIGYAPGSTVQTRISVRGGVTGETGPSLYGYRDGDGDADLLLKGSGSGVVKANGREVLTNADAKRITDWDTAVDTGFYSSEASSTSNAPRSDVSFIGMSLSYEGALLDKRITQIAWSAYEGEVDQWMYMRKGPKPFNSPANLGPWERVYFTQTETDERYDTRVAELPNMSPRIGEQWWDELEQVLKVYNGVVWRTVGGDKPIPYARRWRTSDLSIPDTTWTTIGFGSGESLTDITANASGSIFTVNTDGVYQITSSVRWATASIGRRVLAIHINGTARENDGASVSASTLGIGNTVAGAFRLSAGDKVEINAWQNIGSSLNILGGEGDCNFSMVRIGA